MIRRLAAWIDDRIGGSAFAESALSKIFPDHWSFMLGEIALYSFVVLVVTGIFLSFFFDPSVAETTYHGAYQPLQGTTMSEAYRSTVELSYDVRAGLVMRQAHHWAAIVFIAAIVVHLLRVFFTGAFRRPRELNWIVGVTLLILAFFNGFTGYSLPDDLLSGTGLRIAYSIALSVPVIGTWMAFLIFGGEFPAEAIIPRLFVTHILIVPGAIVALLSVHLALIWRQKHTDFAARGRRESNVVGPKLWPTYAAFSMGLFFAVSAVITAMGGLVQVNPVWVYGPFRVSEVPSPAQPDWWLGWLEGALRIFPPWEARAFGYEIPNPFYPGVLVPTVTFGALYLWPFLEARFTGDRGPHHLLDRARDHPVRTAFGVTALSFFVLLQVAASNDLLAHRLDASVATISWTFRIIVPVVPLVLGFVTYRLMTALQASAAERFAELPLRAVLRPAGNGAKRPEGEGVAAYAPSADGAELVVYPEPDGRWRWCYRRPDDGVELHSNKSYVSPDAAEHYALQAYPDIPLARPADASGPTAPRRS
ncbi:MAG TPA: ubiquinol-cytochrome c reductase cytochrome b subunit [Acidimicrobiales bacterium]|nr:ubiquinol-cytochrome c reductase cytochrome b subunit [Acidimicrobiales bacterium]